MEKILTNKQTDKTCMEIVKLEKMCEKLNKKIVPEFKGLEVCELTFDLLKDVLFDRSAKTIEMIWKQSETEFRNVKMQAVRAMFKKAVQMQIDGFLAATKISIDLELFQYITVSNGAIQLVEGYKESIEKSNYYYIETEQEKAVYDALSKITEGINDFRTSLGEKAKTIFRRDEDFLKFLTVTETGVCEMDFETDYKFLAK